MSPQISFIVPVYNTQQYLNRCFSSIVQQKYEDWEVIVVNDGSTDESLEILQKWALRDRRIKVVTQKNAGLSVARNTGMKYAKSEWIGFIDSDDYIEPNTLERIWPLLNKPVDMICWGVKIIPQPGEPFLPWLKIQEHHLRSRFQGELFFTQKVAQKEPVTVWNKLFRRSIIEKNEINFPAKVLFEDNAFYWKYYPFCKKAFFLKDKLYCYIQRQNSIMGKIFTNQMPAQINACLAGADLFDFYLKQGFFNKYQYLLQTLYWGLFMLDFEHTQGSAKQQVVNEAAQILDKYKFIHKTAETKTILSRNIENIINFKKNGFAKKLFSISRNEYGRKYIYILGVRLWI